MDYGYGQVGDQRIREEDVYEQRRCVAFDDGWAEFGSAAWYSSVGRPRGPGNYLEIPAVGSMLLHPNLTRFRVAAWVLFVVLVVAPGWLLVSPIWRRRHCTSRGLCIECGYNLHGNTTGRCPECGAVVSPLIGEAADGE